jgi:GAF domain-containing protein
MRLLLLEFYNLFFTPRFRYPDTIQLLRARAALALSVVVVFVGTVSITVVASLGQQNSTVNTIQAGLLVVILVQVIIILLVHWGRARWAVGIQYALLFLASAVLLRLYTFDVGPFFFLVILLVYTAFVASWWSVLLVYGIEAIMLTITGVALLSGGIVPVDIIFAQETLLTRVVSQTLSLSAVAVLCSALTYELRRALVSGSRITTHLRAGGELANLAGNAPDAKTYLQNSVNYMRDRFGFYHVQVFFVDSERRYANLMASTGTVGEKMIERGYRLAMGSPTPVSNALQTLEPVVMNAVMVQADKARIIYANELLTETRAQVVLPMMFNGQAVGALDIQSTRPNAFSADFVESLRILAQHVGTTAMLLRARDEQRAELDNANRQLIEADVASVELRQSNKQLTGQTWDSYLKGQGNNVIGYTLEKGKRLEADTVWTSGLAQASSSHRDVISTMAGGGITIAVPITLRGHIIGALEVEMGSDVRQAELLEIMQTVARRLAANIDNARLFEQVQDLAQRELEINTITASMQGITDVGELARVALTELSQALHADTAAIRLDVAKTDPAQPNNAPLTANNERALRAPKR